MSHHRFEESDPVNSPKLDLFHVPPTSFGVDQVQWTEYSATSVTEDGPIEFVVNGSSEHYIDLYNTKLYIKARILKPDGSKLPKCFKNPEGPQTKENWNPAHNVGPVNLWLHSLFSQVDLLMQQTVVSTATAYPYRSYLETLLSPNVPTLGEAELFYKDTATAMTAKQTWGGNYGLLQRTVRAVESQEYDMEGPLHLDLARQERYIVNGVDLGFRLWQSKNAFRIMSDVGPCLVQITKAVLKVCKVHVARNILDAHKEVMLKDHLPMYPVERTVMKTFTVPQNQYEFKVNDVFQGEVPTKLVMGLVSDKSFHGDETLNPYFFLHAHICQAGVLVDDTPVPRKPYTPLFGALHSNSASVFRALYEDNPGISITHDEFDCGYTLFSFKMRESDDDTIPTIQKGNCGIEIKFAEATHKTMTLIIMAKFPDVFTIENRRQEEYEHR